MLNFYFVRLFKRLETLLVGPQNNIKVSFCVVRLHGVSVCVATAFNVFSSQALSRRRNVYSSTFNGQRGVECNG